MAISRGGNYTGEIPESEQLISRILSIVALHRVFRANGRCFADFDSTCQATFRCFRNSLCPGCCYESFSIRTRNCWNTCCRFFSVMMTSFKWTIFFSKKQQQPMLKREREWEKSIRNWMLYACCDYCHVDNAHNDHCSHVMHRTRRGSRTRRWTDWLAHCISANYPIRNQMYVIDGFVGRRSACVCVHGCVCVCEWEW